jgi:site-specific recombinase XerD
VISITTRQLVVFEDFRKQVARALDAFENIKDFEDVERVFLRGQGLSPNSYRTYRQAIKTFYEWTKGKHPLKVAPADVEAFYDARARAVDRNTACPVIKGLKNFYEGVKRLLPFYSSSFEQMPEKLVKKLNRTKKGNRTKKALTKDEKKAILAYLSETDTAKGLENYAIVFMLVTSGLREDELLQVLYGNLKYLEGEWTAVFTGKGDKEAEQELYGPAVEASRAYFKKAFGRDPRSDDAVFYTLPAFPGETPRPLQYHTLWRRIQEIGAVLREAGILKRDLQFSPHLFRRSCATNLYKQGMGIEAVQAKTRHENIETLLKHYVDDEEPANKYIEKMLT